MQQIESRLKVRSYECDSYGHVNNAVYVNYLEFGRMEFLERFDLTLARILQEGFMIVVRRLEVTYHHPAKEAESLLIRTCSAATRGVGGVFEQEIVREHDGKTIITAEVSWVSVNMQGRPVRIPELLRRAIGPAAAGEVGK